MTDILQQVAAVHHARLSKFAAERNREKMKIGRERAYFADTGIAEMFDEVKAIRIANPIPEIRDGTIITLEDLLDEFAEENLKETGIAVHDKNGSRSVWRVGDCTDSEPNSPLLLRYEYFGRRKNLLVNVNDTDAKLKFGNTFVRWLARHITPTMLIDMNIEIKDAAPTITRKTRKILQPAEV